MGAAGRTVLRVQQPPDPSARLCPALVASCFATRRTTTPPCAAPRLTHIPHPTRPHPTVGLPQPWHSKHHFDPRRKSERNPDGTRVTSNLNKTPKGGKGLSGFAGAVEFKDNPMSDQSGKDVGEIDARTNYA